ncbi:MAG: 3-dehydroquinate synthase [Firmicutes bacterium HGW-Firmicutes-5]|nr:MAG: 3-dehydroquinate synthase [Firmicutes bacterium HGW-Firmicutes-5]
MNSIHVETPLKNYNIHFEASFKSLPEHILELKKNYSKIAIISDDQVAPLYTSQVKTVLESLNVEILNFDFAHGEINKNYKTINLIYDFLITNQFDRQSLLIALGGGVVGDMVGFTAATYMRGIDFIQVPTSLLAQVDSSIGGKTGIDFNGYKNIVGAFHQPEMVYVNTKTLRTLPTQEFASGMGEVIKHSLIKDEAYMSFLENNMDAIKGLNHEAITELIKLSCLIKSEIVSKDEREQGLRATLNFGHTIGHAIERLMNFKRLHGECVALGMLAASHISYAIGHLTTSDLDRISSLIDLYNLPVKIDGLSPETIYTELFFDKKTKHHQLNFVLLKTIGTCYMDNQLDEKLIMEGIKAILK